MDHPLDLATVPSSVHLIGRACAAALCSLCVGRGCISSSPCAFVHR